MALSAEYLRERRERNTKIREKTLDCYEKWNIGEEVRSLRAELQANGRPCYLIQDMTNPYWKNSKVLWAKDGAQRKDGDEFLVGVGLRVCTDRMVISFYTDECGWFDLRWNGNAFYEKEDWYERFCEDNPGEHDADAISDKLRFAAWLADRVTDEDRIRLATIKLHIAA